MVAECIKLHIKLIQTENSNIKTIIKLEQTVVTTQVIFAKLIPERGCK